MIEQPPFITQDIDTSLDNEELKNLIYSINSRYLYWSDVKYRMPSGMTGIELWSKVKSVRNLTDVKIWPQNNIHFSLTNTMQRLCHEFDMNFGGSWGASRIFPDDKTTQELYLISSIMEEAIASSQMEGASTTREAAKEMLRKKVSPKDKSQRMILNNYNTINFIRDHAKEKLTPALIMQIHGMMTENALDVPDAAGRLRRDDENIVVGNGITGEIVHTPPSAECLNEFLDCLCTFFNDENTGIFVHPIIRAITIHFLVGYYHPFADGNGRTARALFYWYMMKSNYWLVQYLSISRIIKGSKKSYEKAFLYSEADGNDIGYFIQYNLDVLLKSFDALSRYIKRKNNEKKKAEKLLHLGNITKRQSQILSLCIENSDIVLVSTDIVGKFGVTPNTAKSDLRKLTEKGYLSEISLNGRTKGYIRSANFEQLIGKIK
ncbi:Fic family protein [uncultured Muribaculum sp.]|uniref:Fic family protein n=1 Tax=uncultured Muribaculum sp. TaxID=1918613 RepID=UPI0026DFEBC6|nr:Fic family protein [uncultured Muribaculum sp.]